MENNLQQGAEMTSPLAGRRQLAQISSISQNGQKIQCSLSSRGFLEDRMMDIITGRPPPARGGVVLRLFLKFVKKLTEECRFQT